MRRVFQMRISEDEERQMQEGAEAAGFKHVSKFVKHLVAQAEAARSQSQQPQERT